MAQPVIGVVDLGSSLFRRYMKNKYLNALRKSGAQPVVLGWVETEAQAREALEGCSGLLLPGGADAEPAFYGQERRPCCGSPHPMRDKAEPLYFAEALRRGMPVLGICRGCQMINVLLGGTLYQDLSETGSRQLRHMDFLRRSHHVHTVKPSEGSRLSALCAPVQGVNSMHHQALDRIAPSLRCTAVSEDGICEAVEGDQTPFLLGVQWHPEHLFARDDCAKKIFAAFVGAAQEFTR